MADTDFFLKLEGIDGESQDTDHSAELQVSSWSWGVVNSGTYSKGTGGNSGKASYHDISFTKEYDKASTNIAKFCGTGKAIPSATLTCRKQAGDNKVEYLVIKFKDSVVTSWQTSGSGVPIMESFSLNCAEFHITYQPQGNEGDPAGNVDWGRNVQTNQDA